MGSSGSTDTSSQQQNISQTSLPPWINQAAQQNYALASNIAMRPLTQFQGQQVADIGPQTQQGWNLAATSGGAGADQYNASQAGYLGVLGSTPQQITAAQAAGAGPTTAARSALAAPTVAQQAGLSQLSGANLNAYENPFTQSVINKTLPIMQQQLGLSQNQQANQANAANAFGGSRFGVQQGVTQAQGAQNMAQMAAQLNSQNFAQAQAAAQSDVAAANAQAQFNAGQGNQVGLANMAAANNMGQFNAGQANQVGLQNQQLADQMAQWNAGAQNTAASQNQQAGLTQEQLANAAAGGMGSLGTQAQTNQRQQFLELSTAGAQQQQQAQNQIAAQMGQFSQAQQYPGQQLGILQSALGMTPYGSTTMGSQTGQSQTTTTPSLMADVTGGLQSLGGMFGAGGPFAGVPGAIGNALNTSDKHLKTDITKIGVHPPTGLPIYSYRYKGDPKSYPKVSGPMAEDAMQVAPHAVKTLGVHGPTGQAIHGVDMAALAGGPPGMGAPAGPPPLGVPAIRPQRLPMPGAGAGFASQAPGALAAKAPMGLTGALGATMRPQRMRPPARMARVAGGLRG
jgi:hypothetical protein